jgi:hypothetical protein
MNIEPLVYFMVERYKIYERRMAGDRQPWTDDPILREWKFCNTFRMHDRTTIWLFENWYKPFKDHENLWFSCCLARQINYIPTLEQIGFPEIWDPRAVYKTMVARKLKGEKIYTSAYMLAGRYGMDKPYSTVYSILDNLIKNRDLAEPKPGMGLRDYCRKLKDWSGFGPFLAYEVATDLRHTRYLRDAPDIHTWANPGPGAMRGLNRVYGRELRFRQPRQLFVMEMVCLLHRVRGALPSGFPPIEMRDIEHCLCETDKYLRVKLGQGQTRQRFVWSGDNP